MTTAIKTSLSLSALAALLAACSGSGNTGQSPPSPDIVKQISWVNGALPYKDAQGMLVTADSPVYPPIGQNRPDVGVTAPDCGIVSRYDYAPWVASNEAVDYQVASGSVPGSSVNDVGMAIRWAGADDLTRGSWRTPGFATWYPGLVDHLSNTVWGTPSQKVEEIPEGVAPQCEPGKPNQYVIHMRGDGFRYYGGNIAHILAGDNYVKAGGYDYTDCPDGPDGKPSDLCHPAPETGATVDSAGFPLTPTKNKPGDLAYGLGALHTYWDVSAYEGVSFWARRGPDSFGTLLVTINDKYTSDDMNRQNETYCRRIVACHSACQNYMPCQDSVAPNDITVGTDDLPPAPVKRCFDPAVGMPLPPPSQLPGMGSTDDLLDAIYPRCGNTCNFRLTYPDPDFEGKECRPYTFTSGESAEYCFNADEPPPSREERCVDGFTSSLQLTDQWKFYTVPFSEMRQGGYGKRAPEFDLKSVYSVTLGWGPGSVDFYIDNVSLYRPKK